MADVQPPDKLPLGVPTIVGLGTGIIGTIVPALLMLLFETIRSLPLSGPLATIVSIFGMIVTAWSATNHTKQDAAIKLSALDLEKTRITGGAGGRGGVGGVGGVGGPGGVGLAGK
jgi:uncharacterized membrane protein YgcG